MVKELYPSITMRLQNIFIYVATGPLIITTDYISSRRHQDMKTAIYKMPIDNGQNFLILFYIILYPNSIPSIIFKVSTF